MIVWALEPLVRKCPEVIVIIDLLRDESHGDAGGAGNNKESHEKYFVKPEGNKF